MDLGEKTELVVRVDSIVARHWRRLAIVAGTAAVYFLTGKIGLTLAFVHPSATAVWPPTGVALAALLVFGYETWPGIFLGAFFVNITTAGSALVCVGVASGNTLEAVAGAYLVNRYARGRQFVNRAQDILKFAILAGIFSTTISASVGVISLSLGGYAHWADFRSIWATWWLGDAVGGVIVAPLILLWISQRRPRWRWTQWLEALVLLECLVVAGQLVFGGWFGSGARNYPLEYLCIPLLMWAAFRFGPREAATAVLILCATAIAGTFRGLGPFAIGTRSESFFLLQTFLGVVGIMTLSLSASVAECQGAERQARFLAVSDPLTGLGNYRKLIEALETEIRRSERTGRSFALLLLDLDGLKQINDTHGHLAGDRALCRLAQILKTHSRNIDTAVRHGGDEFGLIIPEADEHAAQLVAKRIAGRLTEEGQPPLLSVSIGAAVWPQDGSNIEELLRAGDRALYEDKRRHHTRGIRH